jgi:hypothetical protein
VSLFEWPLSPCTEFLVGNLAAYPDSGAISASENCCQLHSFVQLEKFWTPGTKDEVLGPLWSERKKKLKERSRMRAQLQQTLLRAHRRMKVQADRNRTERHFELKEASLSINCPPI